MTKPLRKLIMNRSRSKNAYFKNKTADNWERYRTLRNQCVKLTRKVKREYYKNIKMDDLNDNKNFWKTVKPIFTHKGSKSNNIILVENEEILSDTAKISEIMNDYFVNVTKDLDISIPSSPTLECNLPSGDPTDQILLRYRNHPSILKIMEKMGQQVNFVRFKFEFVTQSIMEKQIFDWIRFHPP